jgi:hypothetical protein
LTVRLPPLNATAKKPMPDTVAEAYRIGGWRHRSTPRASAGVLTAIAAV